MRSTLNITLSVFLLLQACQPATDKADHIYFNAKVWTGDSSQPWSKCLVIKGNRIIYTGDDYTPYQDSKTEMTDLGGKLVVPGLIDNHTHFLSGGYNLASVNLRNAKTKAEFIQTLKAYCDQYPDDRWIQGGDWDHEAWGGELPRKEWIDSITGNHPVFLSRYDGHMSLANSKALQLAGITGTSKVPEGGALVLDEKGNPTGVIKDEAMALVYPAIPAPTEKELDEYFERAQQHAFKNGVTQIHDMGSYGGWTDLETYQRNHAAGKESLRIYSFVALSTWAKLDSFCKKNGKGDALLRWGGLKGFVDGSLGSTTAWFYESYLDAPGNTGFAVTDTASLRQWVLGADKAGLQVAVHAIGDRANDFILNVYKDAAQQGKRDRRFRIEHAQHPSEQALSRFAAEQVIPSMQPYHAIDDGKWAYKRLDEKRLRSTYAFHSLLQQGARLTFGSDWTVAPLEPIQGIYAAVTRRTLDDKNPGGWFPEQKINVEQALYCYTVNNAYAGFQETETGKLKKGMLADFVVLSDDLFSIAPEQIRDAAVLRTIIDGKEVYRKN